ncbi:hypothetical protein QCA50_003870 [Cerrena zonata]|uniref:Uncharacterized protein n=1 Tax=Cerrena zonata TaxID=2478898 RepID=A0AAW0GSP4_9APHY
MNRRDQRVVLDDPTQFTPEQQAYHDHLTLLPREVFWRDHQVWLAEQGYMSRPRYKPDWVSSWWVHFEDGQVSSARMNDATRISDGETVMLKKFSRAKNGLERDITLLLPCSFPQSQRSLAQGTTPIIFMRSLIYQENISR